MDRLTMESIAAQKAGMSYGKWKALHHIVEVVVPEVKPEVKRPCKVCGGEIPAHVHKNARHCSAQCIRESEKATSRRCYWKKKEREMANG